MALLPGGGTLLLVSDPAEPWDAALLQAALPPGDWRLDDPDRLLPPDHAALGWALSSYRFTRYRRDETNQPRLALPEGREVESLGPPELVRLGLLSREDAREQERRGRKRDGGQSNLEILLHAHEGRALRHIGQYGSSYTCDRIYLWH